MNVDNAVDKFGFTFHKRLAILSVVFGTITVVPSDRDGGYSGGRTLVVHDTIDGDPQWVVGRQR